MPPRRSAPALVALAALVLAPGAARAQRSAVALTLCGRPVPVHTGPGDAWVIDLPAGPVTLAPGAVAADVVDHGTAQAAVLTVRDDDDNPRYAAVLYCTTARPAGLLWQGSIAWRGEDLGERTRDDAFVRTAGGRRVVVRGRRAEDTALCGQGPTLLDPQALDPATGRFVPVVFDPREELPPATATVQAQLAPRAPGIVPWRTLSVAPAARPSRPALELSDRAPATRWQAPRLGSFTGPVALGGIDVRGIDVHAGTDAAALPARWTLLLEPGATRVEVEVSPAVVSEAARTGGWVRLPLPAGTHPRCVTALAATTGTVAEVALHTALDSAEGDPLRNLARAAGEPDGEAAARILADLGPDGLAALSDALPAMTTVGARRAVRFLAAVADPRVVGALVQALGRADVEEAAARALQRDGAAALAPLAAALRDNPRAAPVLASLRVSPGERLRALARGLGAEGAAWVAVRSEVVRLLAVAAREGGVDDFLQAMPDEPLGASRGLHLLAEALGPQHPIAPMAAAAARNLWHRDDADFATRWRVLRALTGDAEGVTLVRGVADNSDDPDLRAEALRALGQWAPGPHTDAALLEALRADPVPRVRVAAARTMRGRPGATESLLSALRGDRWPSVRAASAEALAGRPEALAALLTALDDGNAVAVRAVLSALGQTPGEGVTPRLVAFVETPRRDPTLRRDGVEALGARCDVSAVSALERIAEVHSDPALPPWELEVGQAALASLARLDAARARQWVRRMGSNATAAAAVERAARAGCGR